MTTRMLIDARHREETRVAVVQGNRIEEFDFESAEHEQLKGNIYLAKVTRVEPSLQAAFVDYGGNRHGFLAFSEIHPDYYQIPKEDRDRLLAEEAEAAEEEAAAREAEDDADDAADAADDDDNGLDEPELVEVDKDTSVDTIDAKEGEIPDLESDDANDDADDDQSGARGRGRGRGRKGNGNGRGRSAARASDAARAKRQELAEKKARELWNKVTAAEEAKKTAEEHLMGDLQACVHSRCLCCWSLLVLLPDDRKRQLMGVCARAVRGRICGRRRESAPRRT